MEVPYRLRELTLTIYHYLILTSHQVHRRADSGTNSRRSNLICSRLDMDLLVSVHCCWILFAVDRVPPSRNKSQNRRQWICSTTQGSHSPYATPVQTLGAQYWRRGIREKTTEDAKSPEIVETLIPKRQRRRHHCLWYPIPGVHMHQHIAISSLHRNLQSQSVASWPHILAIWTGRRCCSILSGTVDGWRICSSTSQERANH